MSYKFIHTTPKSMLAFMDGQTRTITYEIDNCEAITINELCQDFQRFLASCGYCFEIGDSIECVAGDRSPTDSFDEYYDPVDDPQFDEPAQEETPTETPTETQLELNLNVPISEDKPNV